MMSAINAIEQPTPAAAPEIPDTNGIGRSRIFNSNGLKMCSRFSPMSTSGLILSIRLDVKLAPAQNAFSSPISAIASASFSARSIAAANARPISGVMALRVSGWLSCTTATRPSNRYRTISVLDVMFGYSIVKRLLFTVFAHRPNNTAPQ